MGKSDVRGFARCRRSKCHSPVHNNRVVTSALGLFLTCMQRENAKTRDALGCLELSKPLTVATTNYFSYTS
jgi:hypothetical protein